MREEWKEFVTGTWCNSIDVRDFIQKNYTLYNGDESFLTQISEKTTNVWNRCLELLKEELQKGVLDIETNLVSGINSYDAGYIDKDNEVIVGLQTDEVLKRIVNPYGGIRMVYNSLDAYGYKLDEKIDKYFNEFRKTHNQGVFDVYTPEIRKARKVGLLTGLPDAYGRGRIIGDYRRIALYGIDFLIEEKQTDYANLKGIMNDNLIRLREEVTEQMYQMIKEQE